MKKTVTCSACVMSGLLGALSLLLVGCATPRLADVRTVQDEDAAYLVFGAQGQSTLQQEAALRIVSRAYSRIRPLKPAPEARTIDAWNDYLEKLENPIAIDPQSYRTAPELKTISDIKLVADYISRNPDAMSLKGEALLPDWAGELAEARRITAALQAEIKTAVQETRAHMETESWASAYAAVGRAYALAPRDADIRRLAQDVQNQLVAATTADLEKAVGQIESLRKHFGTQQSSLEKVADVERLLSPALDQVLAIQRMVVVHKIPFKDKDTPARLRTLRDAALQDSGSVWAELIRLLGEDHQYWTAYATTMQTLDRIAAVPELIGTGTSNLVRQAFADQVPDAVRHYLEQSNEAFYSDRFGVAFLVSRMCRELYDVATTMGQEIDTAVQRSVGQADQTAEDAVTRIRAQFNRRLLVTDFVPAVTEDYENLGFQIRTRCRYLSLPDNGLAWALEVPAPKTLLLETTGARNPFDLLLSGVMDKKIQVDVLPPVELERGCTEVGTSRIWQVPNPMYNLRENDPRLVYHQEIHLYPWIKTLHRKQARIALRVMREQTGAATLPVYQLDETYPNQDMQFTGLAVEQENLSYHPMILGSPRVANLRSAFAVTNPPVGRAPALAPDDEIARAVINHVIGGVMAAIELEVAQFPVESIAVTAMDYESKQQNDLAADVWGQFLVYIDALAPAGEGTDSTAWLTRRETLRTLVETWNETRWNRHPEELRAAMATVWTRALDAYLGGAH